ncbi:MAG: DUF349 domain-containing protein [Bacteroidales bacterium]|nr:DUF349 domain-containing protein [Bacteroidales bacterium]
MDNTQEVQNVQMQEQTENVQKEEQAQNELTQQTPQTKQPMQEKLSTEEQPVEEKENKVSLDAIIEEYSKKTREELVEELQNIINKNDYEELKSRVPLLRNTFKNLPQPEPQVEKITKKVTNEQGEEEEVVETKTIEDVTEVKFRELYNQYKQIRQDYQQKEEQQKEENLKKKHALLEDLKKLLDSNQTLKEIYDEFNNIQEKWKEIGNVPHTEVNNLWETYHFLIEKFYEKVKINRELRDLDLKKNLEKKLMLCEKVEELLVDEDINNSFAILQGYHTQWKEIGAVPSDKNDEVWERFKRASDAINQRRREYYEKRTEELEENKAKKEALSEKVSEVISREMKTMKDWNAATEEINALFNEWKTIGPIPKKDNETLWTKFKTMIDGFFESKKEMLDKMKQAEEENYNKKLAICVKAEEIAKREDFDAATKELKDLQEEWKHIGYVRKNLSDKIWLRFRAACDEFFNRKSESYLQTHREVEENIKKKQDLIEELKGYQFSEDKQQNVDALKDFQKRWFEIGFTPREERKKLQEQWDEVINANRDKLQISADEIASRGRNNRNSFEKLKEQGDNAVRKRIKSLEDEIARVENNMGFFANSKNADVLKQEFEKKINRLRTEMQDLSTKLKQSLAPKQTVENEQKDAREQPVQE